ncbi:MAG: UbiA family prenyltransferase, partial [Rhodobacteraceae bacterium]|nr:UbiA family prenyltransferase [Paracoccaceae bacterium]
QNIVIGGAAGAFPPMIGWAVATGGISLESVLMFALTFAWTPPHFWSLALFVKTDYADAKVPMLTVTHGRDATRRHILGYTLALAVVSLALGLTSIGGPVYMAVAVVLNLMFIAGAWGIFKRSDADSEADTHAAERKFFKLSLAYLFLHFGALLVETTLAHWNLGGW